MLAMILAAAIEGFKASLHRAVLRQKLLVAAAAIALVALGFLAAAADIWLIPHLGAAGAAAVIGGILLVIALALVAAATNLKTTAAPVATAALVEALERELGALAQPLTIAALIAGFVLARGGAKKD